MDENPYQSPSGKSMPADGSRGNRSCLLLLHWISLVAFISIWLVAIYAGVFRGDQSNMVYFTVWIALVICFGLGLATRLIAMRHYK
jgi:hypothetical protein